MGYLTYIFLVKFYIYKKTKKFLMRMNNNKQWFLLISLVGSNIFGMEMPNHEQAVEKEEQISSEFRGIPQREVEIYKNYHKKQRAQLGELLAHLGDTFKDSAIPAKRESKLKKHLARYNQLQKNTVFKGILSAAAAGGFGYCARKGCTFPETTAAAAVASVGCGLLTLNYVYDWYNLPKPTYELIAEQIEQKTRSCHDWRPIVARKIEKICVSKGK